ncbi:bacillithiol biosynthesis cysteine-adding enzyme BshC [Fodinibius salinus]|uniref:Putative cysteine ligase BshC n=1 Tax=Fodinibius salinus TaxID=860790 RepID=A0A5D3YPW4_9BACT|nr:bacillithiol biosynthesis cysteine-adding enzyme BshC [Fodinibius salinus]TYP95089.1 bacillithiol biosynthesis cysteine-adding enzyme BshC [Fodinibius salinus]
MRLSNYSFEKLPFSDLFKTYVSNFDALSAYFETNPFDEEAIAQKAEQFTFSGNRAKTVELLKDFNQDFELEQAAIDNLDRLKASDSLAVVTGQQLGIYGGPLYTILKIISTIWRARQLEDTLDRPVIPIFWLADEDHDYEEVRKLSVLNNHSHEVEEFALPPKDGDLPTVAELTIPSEISDFREGLKETLYNTDFSDDLWQLLDGNFQSGITFRQAFGNFISALFSKHGLVLAGSNHSDIKDYSRQCLTQSVSKSEKIRASLNTQTAAVADTYHQQVTLYDSNLFYLDDASGRTKVMHNGEGWETDSGKEWSSEQLVNAINDDPEHFSPNVFLRPILQDTLLPTIGYVAGPGEIAYYAQMKEMYSCFGLEMPVIFPRLSATFVEPAIDRICKELPFELHEYAERIEDLESNFVDHTEDHDLETFFTDWKEKVQQLVNPKKRDIADIDPTLEGAVGKANAAYFNELDKLKGKVYRAVKQQENTQLKRIRRIKANLFPDNELQERLVAAMFYMNKYGIDIWDDLLESLDEDEEFNRHKLIYL